MHLAGPLAFRLCGQLSRGPLRRHPAVLLPLRTRGQPSPHVVENAPEATSTAPAGADRAPQGASSSAWAPHPAGRHLRRGHSTWPGACPSGRGHSTPSGTAIPSPGAQDVPDRTEMSPHAQDVPSHDTRVRGVLGIPGRCCANCAGTDVEPRPPGPTDVPEATRQGKARALPGTPESGRPAPPALTGRGGSPLSQQPGAFREDRQVHPVTGTDPLLRTAQVGLDG